MNKFLKWTLIVIASLAVIGFVGMQVLTHFTKKHSPEATAKYTQGDTEVSVKYCRPFKKDRVIFGELVPYGEVWRTGANEATTFVCNSDIMVGNSTVKAGEYTLWTIPNVNSWDVIINEGEYSWGADFSQKATRDPELDVAKITVPVQSTNGVVEQFTVDFAEDMSMMLMWDNVMITVPIQKM